MIGKSFDSIKTYRMTINTLILFFTVFSMDLKGAAIKPRFIVMGFVLAVYLYEVIFIKKSKVTFYKYNLYWIIFLLVILSYSIIVVSVNNVWDTHNAINDTINFVIFLGIYPIILKNFFKDEKEFCQALTYATTIHSLIVIYSFISPNMRRILEMMQVMPFERYNYRIIGLGIAGAGGSIYLSVGLITCTYLLLFNNTKKNINRILFLIITVAIFLVGRTGFYIVLALVIYLLFFNNKTITKNIKNSTKTIITWLALMIVLYFVVNIINVNINTELFTYTFNRAFELFTGESKTLNELNNMNQNIPSLSFETLIGTGIVRGETATGLIIQHDGGYIKRYVSIGLIMAIISYSGYILYNLISFSRMSTSKKWFMYYVMFLLLIIEYKEPFIYMLAFPFTILMISNLYKNQNSHYIIKDYN